MAMHNARQSHMTLSLMPVLTGSSSGTVTQIVSNCQHNPSPASGSRAESKTPTAKDQGTNVRMVLCLKLSARPATMRLSICKKPNDPIYRPVLADICLSRISTISKTALMLSVVLMSLALSM